MAVSDGRVFIIMDYAAKGIQFESLKLTTLPFLPYFWGFRPFPESSCRILISKILFETVKRRFAPIHSKAFCIERVGRAENVPRFVVSRGLLPWFGILSPRSQVWEYTACSWSVCQTHRFWFCPANWVWWKWRSGAIQYLLLGCRQVFRQYLVYTVRPVYGVLLNKPYCKIICHFTGMNS